MKEKETLNMIVRTLLLLAAWKEAQFYQPTWVGATCHIEWKADLLPAFGQNYTTFLQNHGAMVSEVWEWVLRAPATMQISTLISLYKNEKVEETSTG
jgi:hypothetical protein